MGYRYTVLGAGRQGCAIAYDLAKHGEAESIGLFDKEPALASQAAEKVNKLLERRVVKGRGLDASTRKTIRPALEGTDVVVSALPYFLNLEAAWAAVEEGAHFCDLGGNTDIVLKELKLDDDAKAHEVSLLPDCGLAPGLSNLLAARILTELTSVRTIRARCGGLPVEPRPPLNYKMVFSLDGLINEYSGEAIFLRGGKIVCVPALSEIESISIPGVGQFEAAVTTGGTSTAPWSFEGRVENFDYKTLRYPGHYEAIKPILALPTRDAMKERLMPLIDFPKDRDRVILFVEGHGERAGKPARMQITLVDDGDPEGTFSAMERTTGFPTATIAHLQAMGKIPIGAAPIEKVVPLVPLLEGIRERGLNIIERFV